VADAGLMAGLGLDQAQQAEARRVGDRLQCPSQLLGVRGCERSSQERWARSGDGRNRLHRTILTEINVVVIIAPRGASIAVGTETERRDVAGA
jgi:hypothetical protein